RGYAYRVMTDHTQSLQIAQGLTPERFRQRASEIADVNGRRDGAQVLNGAEVDILPDGSLDLPDDCLASLDVVVASVHTALDQPKDVITQRVLSALRSPHVDVLAHPTSRRLDRRGETSLDIEAVIAEAVKTGTALEINSSPWRLDLNDSWARKAREAGAMLAIDTDAHYPAQPNQAPLKDVPFIIEGPAGPMRRLQSRLELFRQKRTLIPDAPEEAYSWTDLIPLSDELFILAFRDESLQENPDDPASEQRYIANLIRPLVFPFLK